MTVEGAKAFGIARHLIEQDRRRGAAALFRQHLGDGAHFGVPMGAVDMQQLAHLLHFLEPSAQTAIADLSGGSLLSEHGGHRRSPSPIKGSYSLDAES